MRRLLAILAFAFASAAWAAEPVASDTPQDSTNAIPVFATPQAPNPDQVNEIRRRRSVFSGSIVQVIKTKRVFELVNPFAKASAGSGAGNTAFDPITGKPVGLKLIAVSY